MLAAFEAQLIHELKPRDKSKIESLLGYGDRLLVGLNTGSLRIYRVNNVVSESAAGPDVVKDGQPSSGESKQRVVELLKEEERFSKKPIQQLARIKEANVLVSLSDGYVSLHDLQTFELVERIERTKGALCFTVTSHVVRDADTEIPSLTSRLAVAVKRKVLCWSWQDMEMSPEITEINMEATTKSLTWIDGTKLTVGMDAGFSVLDVISKAITPINKPITKSNTDATTDVELAGVRFAAVSSSGMGYMGMGSWLPRPMAAAISQSQILLAKDVNTLFIDGDGKPLEKRQIPWSLAPEAIGYSYPYLLALLPPEKGTLHIRNPDSLNLLQSISVPGATILHVPQSNISLAHAGKGFLAASDRAIWRMNALPYDSQIQELLQKGKYDEAISLLGLLEDTLIDDKFGRIREVSIQKAIMWFNQRKYQPALDLLTDVQAPVERVIALYPRSIAGDLSIHARDSDVETDAGSDEGESKKTAATADDAPATPSKSMLSKFVGGSAPSKDSDTASIRSFMRSDTARNKAAATQKSDKPLEGQDLKLAVRELSSFLAQARQQVQKFLDADGHLKEAVSLNPETGKPAFANLLSDSVLKQGSSTIDWQMELLKVAQLVDTTLFKAYMLASPGLAGPLFRVVNFCDPEVVQDSLYEHDRYSDLIDFLHGKKLHRQALEMLQKFGKGDADAEIPEGMQGPRRSIAYLQQLPPESIDLILEFVTWPLSEDVEATMEVFLADSDNAENLPRDRVLSFLAKINVDLNTRYLEHIINELGDDESEHHQRLADAYIHIVKDESAFDEARRDAQTKLETFLQKSQFYNKAKTFRQLPTEEARLFESRAIVLAAMGNHKQALSIYVFQLQDYTKAEGFCDRIYRAQQDAIPESPQSSPKQTFGPLTDSESEGSNIFATLLGLYLQPPPDQTKRWPQALDLLSRYGARLPTTSTLPLIPDDLAVQQLQDYFRGRIRHTTSLLRQEKILRGLEDVRRANTERHLQLGLDEDDDMGIKSGRNRRVRITEEDHCPVCHKRFGASAIRVYPDGTVVHYGCWGKNPPGQDSTGRSLRPGMRMVASGMSGISVTSGSGLMTSTGGGRNSRTNFGSEWK